MCVCRVLTLYKRAKFLFHLKFQSFHLEMTFLGKYVERIGCLRNVSFVCYRMHYAIGIYLFSIVKQQLHIVQFYTLMFTICREYRFRYSIRNFIRFRLKALSLLVGVYRISYLYLIVFLYVTIRIKIM